jgi:hypothetical protein
MAQRSQVGVLALDAPFAALVGRRLRWSHDAELGSCGARPWPQGPTSAPAATGRFR